MPLGWGVVGAPSSVAAHWPGLEKAPAALRAAGVVDALLGRCPDVVDFGDLPEQRWVSDRRAGLPNNSSGVLEGLRRVRDRVRIVAAEHRPFVIGGECTLTIAVVSALLETDPEIGLIYVDGGQDLMVPSEHPEEPILDAMGVAHLLDLPGTVEDIAAIGPRRPLLTPSRVVFYGFGDPDEDDHDRVPARRFPAPQVTADPARTAAEAIGSLGGRRFIVHLDVDVLDFLHVPAADVPLYGRGLDLDSLASALRVLLTDPRCAALSLVEYNPDHDPTGQAARALADVLVENLGGTSS